MDWQKKNSKILTAARYGISFFFEFSTINIPYFEL